MLTWGCLPSEVSQVNLPFSLGLVVSKCALTVSWEENPPQTLVILILQHRNMLQIHQLL